MSEAHENHLPKYTRVIITLAVLTAIEFGIAALIDRDEVGAAPSFFMIGVLLLIALAAWKAVLVGRVFMHLTYDPRILSLIACTPVVLAAPLVILCTWDGNAFHSGFGFN